MTTPCKRIIVKKPGGYKVFQFDDTPIEDPQPGEIQVDVKASGINFADVSVRLGLYAAAKGAYPLCPGLEFSGVVRRIGRNAGIFKPGDKVIGVSRFGGYTTVINSPLELIWPLPPTWDFTRGASFSVNYITAHYALHHVGHLRKSDRVLIHSAAGGVGTALLHLLKIHGNMSVGVVGRSKKVAAAKEAGATFVIDKGTEDLWRRATELSPEGYDMILDANGASTLKDSYRHLKPAGRLLIYGFASMFSHSGRKNYFRLIWYYLRTPHFNPFDLTGDNKTVSGFNLIYLFDRVELFHGIMKTLLKWDAKGNIPAMPITIFSFENVAKAHQAIESRESVGKLVLVVA
jgi:NADPH:quinone reductase-like Zn-dependent oxidoreductase